MNLMRHVILLSLIILASCADPNSHQPERDLTRQVDCDTSSFASLSGDGAEHIIDENEVAALCLVGQDASLVSLRKRITRT